MNDKTAAKREISIVTWKEIRSDVLKTNKALGGIIDSINPDDSYKFVKASYLYGDIFVKNGKTLLPIQNKLTPLSNPSIPKEVQKELTYSPIPLFLILEKSCELFVDTKKRVVPINLFHKGSLSGIYETMDYMMGKKSDPVWNFSAGSRSIFMLPKITDNIGLNKLRTTYNIPSTERINQLPDHWEILKDIAQSKNTTKTWQNTCLFFGKKWLDEKQNSQAWNKFKNYLFNKIWDHANYAIDKVKFNICWESYTAIIASRRLQPKPYLIDQVKHLLSIIVGNFPAFTVVNNSQDAAPTDLFQEAFIENYGLKQYLPTLMHACMPHDKIIKPNYTYYSLAMPTILEGSPLKKTSSTIVNDLREIKLIIETLKNKLENNCKLEIDNIIQKTEIDYFHYKKDVSRQIKASDDAPIEDNSFLKDKNRFKTRVFCPTSPFFSGCVRIKPKKS